MSLDLDGMRARVEAATPGPWRYNPHSRLHESPTVCASVGIFVGAFATDPPDWAEGRADAEFVAHARTDVPVLLAEVERLRATLTAMVDDHPFVLDGDNGAMVASWFVHEIQKALDGGPS